MNFKSTIILISFFFIQLFSSCDLIMRCDDAVKYQVNYGGISLIAWNTAGFQVNEIADSIHRNSFGLMLHMLIEQKIVLKSKNVFFSNGAYAFSCPDDEYNLIDPIDHVEIHMTNVSTDERQNVSELFGVYGYSGELISLAELFSIRQEWHDGFQFELVEFDSIPTSVVFLVNVNLESGKMFSEQTQQINFHN